jgi:uncharacterized protein
MADLGFRQISVEPVALGEKSPLSIRGEDLERIFSEYEALAFEIIKRNKASSEGKKDEYLNFFHFMIDLAHGPCALKRISGCGAGCEYLAVTPNGDIYPCHQFAGNSEFKMGNVLSGEYSGKFYREFKTRDIYTVEGCRDCFAKFYCGGGCAANSYNFEGSFAKPYKIGCAMQKKRVECAIGIQALIHNS